MKYSQHLLCIEIELMVRPHLLQAHFSRSCTVHLLQAVQYGFCTIFEDSLGTKFEAGSGTKIEVADYTFQAQISRSYSSINCCPYSTDYVYAGTVFEG